MSDVEVLLAALRTDGGRLVELASGDLTAGVPTCPGWTLGDLLVHLGRVHRWAATAVATPVDGDWPRFGAKPSDGEPLGPWLRAGLDQLDGLFAGTELDRPAWSFTEGGTAGWWLRRQALETAMHRWDGQLAAGQTADQIGAEAAAIGVDEWCELESARWFRPSDEVNLTVHLHATDDAPTTTPGEWFLEADATGFRWNHGHQKADIAVRAGRSELFLVVWRRLPPSQVEVLGDEEKLNEFLLATAVD